MKEQPRINLDCAKDQARVRQDLLDHPTGHWIDENGIAHTAFISRLQELKYRQDNPHLFPTDNGSQYDKVFPTSPTKPSLEIVDGEVVNPDLDDHVPFEYAKGKVYNTRQLSSGEE